MKIDDEEADVEPEAVRDEVSVKKKSSSAAGHPIDENP